MTPCFLVFCTEVGPLPHFHVEAQTLGYTGHCDRYWGCFKASRDLGTTCIHTGFCKLFQILKEPLFLLNSYVLSKEFFFFLSV